MNEDKQRQLDYRFADANDVPELAALFRRCMPHSLWVQLGSKFTELYIRHYCTSSTAAAVVAATDSVLLGGCTGAVDPDHDRYRFYKENGWDLVRLLAAETMVRPSVASPLLSRLARGARQAGTQVARRLLHATPQHDAQDGEKELLAADASKTCAIATIFVDPNARGHGIAAHMLRRFTQQMAARGFAYCRAGTTADNIASQRSLQRAGFRCVGRSGAHMTYLCPLAGSI